MGIVGDRGAGSTSAGAMMWDRGSAYSGVGTIKVPKRGSSVQAKIKKAMIHGTSSYRDIDNALSAGGHDGSGSLQTTKSLVKNKTSLSSSSSSRRSSGGSYGGSSGGSSGYSSGSTTSAKETFDYYEAPLAKYYGFNKATAYQEALANTAYRREMNDMRKAGLNPSVIYGDHNTSGAYSNIYPEVDEPAPSYGGHSSGGSGGSGRRYRGRNSGKYAFSGAAYYGIMAAAGAVTAVATKNVGAGMAAAGLVGTGLKALNGILKKR